MAPHSCPSNVLHAVAHTMPSPDPLTTVQPTLPPGKASLTAAPRGALRPLCTHSSKHTALYIPLCLSLTLTECTPLARASPPSAPVLTHKHMTPFAGEEPTLPVRWPAVGQRRPRKGVVTLVCLAPEIARFLPHQWFPNEEHAYINRVGSCDEIYPAVKKNKLLLHQ